MLTKKPTFLQFKSPWLFDLGQVRLPSPPEGVDVKEISQRLRSGELMQPYIFETSSERRLYFTSCAVQSIMNIKKPNDLVVAYTQKMMSFLLFNPNPRNIVMVGLGGGSLPKFCYRYLRKTQITVVEIDPAVIALRDEFCVPKDDHRFQVIQDDGARFISNLTDPVDVILIDAFDPVGIATSLADSNFYSRAASQLTPEGVLVMNLSGKHSRYADHINHITKAFGGNALLVPVTQDDNLLVFAFQKKIDITEVSLYEDRAQQLKRVLSLDFPRFFDRICSGEVLA
jgi:spermidine synthase